MSDNKWVLICGSRKATHELMGLAVRAVEGCKERGYSVNVGDAWGIDQTVAYACERLGVPHIIYGIKGTWRFHTDTGSLNASCRDYLERDRLMVDQSHTVIALCYRKSSGTMYTYNYAVKQGKRALLIERD